MYLDKPSPRFVQTFGETRIFLIGRTRVLAQVGRRVARFSTTQTHIPSFWRKTSIVREDEFRRRSTSPVYVHTNSVPTAVPVLEKHMTL